VLDSSCYFVERYAIKMVPVVDQRKDLVYFRPEVDVGGEHVPHQVTHLFGVITTFVFDGSIDDAELALILKGMVLVVEDIQDTAQHPDIYSLVDGVLEVEVDHLGRSVHQGGVLFKPLLMMIHFRL